MADETTAGGTDGAAEAVESIPVPSSPNTQVLKSSDEILSELFGAFNATPPPLDDVKPLETSSVVSDKSHKKHKKHSKKKHKKVKKKKKRSSSSDSSGSKESKKKSSKKQKKHCSKHQSNNSDSANAKKKKRKLGKFSASDDSESEDDEEPTRKKRKSSTENKLTANEKLLGVKVKEEVDSSKKTKINGSTVSTVPEVIRENILKQAVSKIVDKVIRSTDLASEICKSINGVKLTSNHSSDKETDLGLPLVGSGSSLLSKPIKEEPGDDKCLKNNSEKSVDSSNCEITENKTSKSPEVSKCSDESQENIGSKDIPEPPKTLPVADVFAEDLIDCGIKKDELKPNSDKPKPSGGKIKIPNLKFSQVYEATVKQIEEEAKLKAEKYEEGEISESSEEERSPTPSDISSTGSVEDVKKSEDKKKHHHHHRHRHHHRSRHRSRSHDKHRSHSHSDRTHTSHQRDKHREKDRDREKRRSRERERDREKGRSRDRRERSRERKRSKERTRDRSRSGGRARDRVRSRSRSRERRRSRSKSKDRTKTEVRQRSKSRDKKTKDRERSKERKRSRERSKERKRSRDRDRDSRRHAKSRTRSREREKRSPEEKIDKQKLLEIARKNALNMLKNPSGAADQTKLAITSGGKTVNELTDFCKLLSKKDADGHESISSNTSGDESETEKPFHHPFLIKDRPNSIVLNIRNSVALPVKSLQEKAAEQSRQLRLQFPVSSGQLHRKTESEWIPVSPKRPDPPPTTTQVALVKPTTKRVFKDPPPTPDLDIGSIVSKRLDAIRRLQENPTDSEALTQMQAAQQHMQTWAESKQLPPGQFSGSTGVKVLSQAELASGYQAWARRDQLQVAAPVNNGVGMTLLQKMGWRPGEGLGKNKEGTLQPLLLEVKMDKKGLVAQEELPVRQPHQILRGKPRSLEGKHPVSLLNEYCSRRKLGPPYFELVDEAGPDHKKNFLFKVRVNGVEYKPAVGSPKKKQARAEAAEVCLKALGILPNK